MLFQNKEAIQELYEKKSFSILSVPISQSEYLAFNYQDFQSLLNFLKEDFILISSIELYDKKTYAFSPPSFWYSGNNLEECFNLIVAFLGTLIDCNSQFYTVWINTNSQKSLELKISLDEISKVKESLKKI